MNLKFKKLYATLAVGLLTALSFAPTLNTEAALTAPTSWTFKYTNQDAPGFKLRSQTAVISIPTYVRTADSTYWNYTSTFTITTGLTATQTFNRSNSTWAFDAASGNYIPSAAAVGSDATVGGVNKKWYVKIDNQTNKDYKLYLDFSSTNNINRIYHYYVNGEVFVANLTNDRLYYVDSSIFFDIWISAYSYVEFYTENGASNLNYLDAWYLQDLGVSAAYEQGVDDGYIQGQDDADLLVTGFSAMVGILVNFVLMIVNLEVFGVSILSVFSILVIFVGIIWILKIIRG